MKMNKLKPCPFCGKQPERQHCKSDATGTDYWWIECTNDKCLVQPETSAYTSAYSTKGADARAWNRRADNGK